MIAVEIRGIKECENEKKFLVAPPKNAFESTCFGRELAFPAQGSRTGGLIGATVSATTHFPCICMVGVGLGQFKTSDWSDAQIVGMGRSSK
jgi:hypothetical protein